MYELTRINGKDVYIVDAHHWVLLPWSRVRCGSAEAPNLISLDHHTDTRGAFHSHICEALGDDQTDYRAMRDHLLAALDWRDERSVLDAIHKLNNDEHIHTATATDILNFAFVIQLSNGTGSYLQEKRIVEVPHDCVIGCQKRPHDDDCYLAQRNQVLELTYLSDQLDRLSQMAKHLGINALEPGSYVLDIDLDFFHTARSIRPHEPSAFQGLIRGATAITIAKEPNYVEDLRVPGETISSETLLHDILSYIETA